MKMKFLHLLLLMIFSLFLSACTTLNGNVHLLRVSDQDKLYGPWKDKDKSADIIPKAGKEFTPSMEDAFSIYFDQAFFKYLQDSMNSNEVIILFSFYEGHDETNKTVKILGPMKRTADSSYSQWMSKVSYGPTRLESDFLTVEIDIIEYDAEENKDNAAFLDFVGGAAETFSLANPVTAGEIKVAKELAKTLLAMNDNDSVMKIKFDLIPYSNTIWSAQGNPEGIPLKTGRWAVIKQEQNNEITGSYFSLSRQSCKTGTYAEAPFRFVFDTVLTPIVFFKRMLTDTPNIDSKEPLTTHAPEMNYVDNGENIIYENSSKKLLLEKDRGFTSKADEEKFAVAQMEESALQKSVSNIKSQLQKELTSRVEAEEEKRSAEDEMNKALNEFDKSSKALEEAKKAIPVDNEAVKKAETAKAETAKDEAAKKKEEAINKFKNAEQIHKEAIKAEETSRVAFNDTATKLSDKEREIKGFLKNQQIIDAAPYESKTWLTFSIERGGDARNTSFRKIISESEQKILDLLKKPNLQEALGRSGIDDALISLNDAKEKMNQLESQMGFKVLTPENAQTTEASLTAGFSIAIQVPPNVGKKTLTLRLMGIKESDNSAVATKMDKLGAIGAVVVTENVLAKATLAPALAGVTLEPGISYSLYLDYVTDRNEMATAKLPLTILRGK